MKILRFALFLGVAVVSVLSGCTRMEEPDYREKDYGYVQFKLYKEASYNASSDNWDNAVEAAGQVTTRANNLDYLSDAAKIKVTLEYEETPIKQTLILSAANKDYAEYGLRSAKLKLLAGDYKITFYELYDNNDNPVYEETPTNQNFSVKAGGNVQHDLTAKVPERGTVRFTLVKDMSDFEGWTEAKTKAGNRQYTFDEVKYVDIRIQPTVFGDPIDIKDLETEFDIHFEENDDNRDGYRISELLCDSMISLTGGKYRLSSYTVKDERKNTLEVRTFDRASAPAFDIKDNETTDFNVPVTLYETDAYIQDYYALRTLWEHLNGDTWSYYGEDFAAGTNWDFNKDVDLWGEQPGVRLHSNGRVAYINISDFGFSGFVGPEIGQLTELIELYLGTHNDHNVLVYDPSLPNANKSYRHDRMAAHREYQSLVHPFTQVSYPAALAAQIKGEKRQDTALYDTGFTEDGIFDKKGMPVIRPMDTNHGKICNRLESIDPAIGNCTKLEFLFIANSTLESLPEEIGNLKVCSDLEIYNCPNMTEFPIGIGNMPELVSLNLSNNAQWTAEECLEGMTALANGPSAEKIQIFYFRQNKLEKFPAEVFGKFKKIGMLDLAYNKINEVEALGESINFVQLFLDHNEIADFPENFCGYDDMETINLSYNRLTVFPKIGDAESLYTIGGIDLSYNQINAFPSDFKGVNVGSLGLSGNRFESYPAELIRTNSVISSISLRANGMKEIPEDTFKYEEAGHNNLPNLTSLDLSYNKLKELPEDLNAVNIPYLYALEISSNCFSEVPFVPLSCAGLTVYSIRNQRSEDGSKRTLTKWPVGIYKHTGLRGLFLGSNDFRLVDDTISTLCYNLDIADNPNIEFDAKDICNAWRAGLFNLIYDRTQNIVNCPYMLD